MTEPTNEIAWKGLIQSDKVPCSRCQNETSEFHASGFYGLCSDCYSLRRKEENEIQPDGKDERNQELLEARIQRWTTLCPELYRVGDVSFIDQEAYSKVIRWKLGQKGMIVSGRSRAGKTTSCWHLIHKLYVLEGRSFIALSEPEFSIQRDKHSRQGGLDAFLEKCIRCDILFLDDIGHAATNSRNLEELYHIVEKRTSWKRPILCTTNFTREEIEERAAGSGARKTAIAIMNRISNFCYLAQF